MLSITRLHDYGQVSVLGCRGIKSQYHYIRCGMN